MQMGTLIETFVDSLFVSKHIPIEVLETLPKIAHIDGLDVISGRRRH